MQEFRDHAQGAKRFPSSRGLPIAPPTEARPRATAADLAAGSGSQLVEKQPRVRILGQERQLRARVEVMNAFSAHGDKNDLLEFAMKAGKDSQRIFLVHGEPDSQDALRKTLEEHHLKVSVPALGEVAEL